MTIHPEASTSCDVAVIGGGLAGAALATLLSRAGHRCMVFEQSRFPRYHIGESLIPHTPDQRAALIDCLIGDVVGKDMRSFTAALSQMTPPPAPLVA